MERANVSRTELLGAIHAIDMNQREFADLCGFRWSNVQRYAVSRPVPRIVMLVLHLMAERRLLREALERATGQGPAGFMDEPPKP